MREHQRKFKKFAELSDRDLYGCDRYIYSGRRGTGKSTAIKRWIASGKHVVWIAATKVRSSQTPRWFVPPAVAHLLPEVEQTVEGDTPEFRFGNGHVVVLPRSMIEGVRDTGLSVDGKQAQAIVCDELIKVSGRYVRNEPLLLDDLAGTLGRSGERPIIIGACNPTPERENAQPYAYKWRADFSCEGDYEDKNHFITRIRGTGDCDDCFNLKIGVDATEKTWATHLETGGTVVSVNGESIRCRGFYGWFYVGLAEGGDALMDRDRYTALANTGIGMRFITELRQAFDERRVVFDSFEAQMRFYELIRAK